MRRILWMLTILAVLATFTSCASIPKDRYNTQKGAAIGAGVGAIAGQIIGRVTEGTLIGAAVGTMLGATVGNAIDQKYQAEREGARTNQRVVYRDNQGGVVEATPVQANPRGDCRQVTTKVWNNGKLVSETIEEICDKKKSETQNY